jgi:hypothetical protein
VGKVKRQSISQLSQVFDNNAQKETHFVHHYLGRFARSSTHLLVLFRAATIQHAPKKKKRIMIEHQTKKRKDPGVEGGN